MMERRCSFGGSQGEALTQIETHLITECADGTGSGTIPFDGSVGLDMAKQIEIGLHGV